MDGGKDGSSLGGAIGPKRSQFGVLWVPWNVTVKPRSCSALRSFAGLLSAC